MHALHERLRLMYVTESGGSVSALAVAEAALAGGATAIQLRWKEATTRQLVEAGRRLRYSTAATGALLIVNDRVDVALVIGADGCHLGADDLPLGVAVGIVRRGFILGRSVDTAEEAAAAEAAGASYVGLGPIYPTATKVDTGGVVGVHGVTAARRRISIPLIGIGGIGRSNAGDVIAAGADGVAVVTALSRAHDPAKAAAELIAAVGVGRGLRDDDARGARRGP